MKVLKVGCGWWGFREKPLEDHFEICRRFGFATLEVGIGDEFLPAIPLATSGEALGQIRLLAEEQGIRIPFATIESDFTFTDRDKHRQMMAQVEKAIQIAEKLQSTHLRFFAGFTPAEAITERLYQQVLTAFNVCEERCSQAGILISIETHGRIEWKADVAFHHNTISTDPHFLARLLRDLPETIGFNYDPGNMKAVRPDDKKYGLDLLNHRINYCHLKDWKRKDGGWTAAAPGDDDLDYGVLLSEMKFDGTYLIEYEPLEDLEAGISRSLHYLKKTGFTLSFV